MTRPPPPVDCTGTRIVFPPALSLSSVVKLIDGKDTNLGNSPTDLLISAWIRRTPKRVYIYGTIKISENDRGLTVFDPPDDTTFRQDFEHVLYDAGECEVQSHQIQSRFLGLRLDATGYLGATQEGDDRYALQVVDALEVDSEGNTQPIAKARCRLGGSGDDKGKAYCDRIWFNKIRVTLRPERVDCGSVSVWGGKQLVFPLFHRSGDDEIGGSSRIIELTGPDGLGGGTRVERGEDGVARLRGTVAVTEMEGDRTAFSRRFTKTLLEPADLPDHCEVGSVGAASDYESRVIHAVRDHDWTLYPTTGKVRALECRTDSKGGETGRTGCEISFGAFEVPLQRKP